eukprot:COSAG02_NODE_29052_length_576_cov_22.595388_1_plen_110_part_10
MALKNTPRRRLFAGWGSWGRVFNAGLAGQMARTRDANADRGVVSGDPVLLSTTSPHGSSLRDSSSFVVMPSNPSPLAAVHSAPFDPSAVRLDCMFVRLYGSLCASDCSQD